MADELAIVTDPEGLFLCSGDDVNPNRPVYTGDVFSDVTVDVLGHEAQTVAVLSHPCAMRRGPELEALVHVAPVVEHSGSGTKLWTGNFRIMSIQGLPGFTNPAIRLDQMTLAPSASLDRDRRVACLSRPGINILRQRLVNHLTRVVIDLSVLDLEAAPAHEEVDLLEEWVDVRTDCGVTIADAEREFDVWLGEEERRAQLGDPAALSGLRRAARAAARTR